MNFEGVGTCYNCPPLYLNGCTFILLLMGKIMVRILVVEIVAYVIGILMRLLKGMHACVKNLISLFKPWQWFPNGIEASGISLHLLVCQQEMSLNRSLKESVVIFTDHNS